MFTLSRCNPVLHDNTLPQKEMTFTFPLYGSGEQVLLVSLPPEAMEGSDLEPPSQPISEHGEHHFGTSSSHKHSLESTQTSPERCPSFSPMQSQARRSWGIDFIMMPWLLLALKEQRLAELSSWCVESFLDGSPAGPWDQSGGEARLQTCAVSGSRACRTWRCSRAQLHRSTRSQASLLSTHRPATANQSGLRRCHCLLCIN